MLKENEQEEFEKWADGYFAHGPVWKRLDKSNHGNYQNAAVQTAWISWRAANILAKIPSCKSFDEGYLEATQEMLPKRLPDEHAAVSIMSNAIFNSPHNGFTHDEVGRIEEALAIGYRALLERKAI